MATSHRIEQRPYSLYNGTSAAAPIVSGIAALLWSARPEAEISQVRTALLTGTVHESLRGKVETASIVDARLAWRSLSNPNE